MSPVARLTSLARRELWLLIAFAVVAASLFILLRINAEIAEGETISFDRALLLYFRDAGDPARMIGPPGLTLAVRDITALGGATLLVGDTGSAVPAGAASVTRAAVTLDDLRQALSVGPTYPVTLTFERAGSVTLELPVDNPDGR